MATSEWSLVSKPFNILPEPFPESFSEEDISVTLSGIFKTIDVPFRKSEPVPKTILVDFFGSPKSGKTGVTGIVEQVFRRHGFNVFCPPETAEREDIRSDKYKDSPLVFQARHDTGVQQDLLHLAAHPRLHIAITSRGLIDRLYWYAKDMRKGLYSQTYYNSVREHIYELLKQDFVDALFFFTCSVEAAMQREYSQSLTEKRGSNMNESDLSQALDIYHEIRNGVDANVPGLPIFDVDTTNLSMRASGLEVFRFLLPVICRRFSVPSSQFLPYSPGLMRKVTKHAANLEEQLKLRGWPSNMAELDKMDWVCMGKYEQEDTYLDPNLNQSGSSNISGELLRIRKDNKGLRFIFKEPSQDRIFSCRHGSTFHISQEETEEIKALYKTIAVVRKSREYFQLRQDSDGNTEHFFTMHIDRIEGLGDFTEIRAMGSKDRTYTQELRELAVKLGFSLTDIVEGSYLSLALKQQSS